MVTVVVVDDQELVRTGLIALAERDGDIEVVAEAANGRDGVAAAARHLPDVVLMDIRMPIMDGVAATRDIIGSPAGQEIKVLMLTTFDDDADIADAIRAGAVGYLLKDIEPGDLRAAIRSAAAGDGSLSPSIARRMLGMYATEVGVTRPELVASLTQREREVLQRIGMGQNNTEIGSTLHISPATARTYVSRLLSTLGARDRSQLVVIAYESGLVRPGDPKVY